MRARALLVAVLLAPLPSLSAAGPRRDLAADERCGGHTLARHVGRTDAELAERLRRRPNLALRFRGDPRGSPIGRSLRRGRPRPEPCVDAVVVLRWDDRREGFCVLTSYPEARR